MVTGATRGIGRRVALTLVERGYRIAANDLDAPEETLEGSKRAVACSSRVPSRAGSSTVTLYPWMAAGTAMGAGRASGGASSLRSALRRSDLEEGAGG